MSKIILLTSNKDKLKEFQEYLPEIVSEEGEDLPEIDSLSLNHNNEYCVRCGFNQE